ncbi:MAG: response regulator [Bacteroidales bacterium]|nr:response regulator [Bacteroidales bacterium]
MNPYKIIVIDDNLSVLRTLKLVLNGVFKTVVTVPDPKLIPAMLNVGDVDVVLLDMNFDARKLDGEEGLFWLNRINEMPNPPAVVLITAFGDIDLAVRSVQQGAEDFITKPWDNQTLIQKLEAAITKHRAKQQTVSLAAEAVSLHNQMAANKQLSLEELEKKHILEVVDQVNGNLVNAAERLGISRQTLYNKLKKFGVII